MRIPLDVFAEIETSEHSVCPFRLMAEISDRVQKYTCGWSVNEYLEYLACLGKACMLWKDAFNCCGLEHPFGSGR